VGEIIIGEYLERFEVSTSFWSVEDYQEHWKQAIRRVINGEDKSCLITSMYNPESANFIFWWPIYRVESEVFIQNQVLFLNDETIPFNPRDPYASVKDRETLTEDGLPISEWVVPLLDLQHFLAT
jgi:hypothetical protein